MDTMKWLLEESNPSVRYLTMTELLELPKNDSSVQEAKKAIMTDHTIEKMLELQNPDGSWGAEERFYLDKYQGSVWNLLLLAELGADPEDPRVCRACEFILTHSQDPEGFGFSIEQGAKTKTGLSRMVIPCLTGNMVYSLIKLGYLQNARVQNAIQWILDYQQADDGVIVAMRNPIIDRLTTCFGKHSCHMGVAKALKALSAIPEEYRTKEIKAKIDQLTEYFLIHRIYKKSHDLSRISKPGWVHFGFPLMYQTDVLELLKLFAELHIKDARLDDAIDLVVKKQNADGVWLMENSFNGKMLVDIEKKDAPSKWITLRALYVLKEYRSYRWA